MINTKLIPHIFINTFLIILGTGCGQSARTPSSMPASPISVIPTATIPPTIVATPKPPVETRIRIDGKADDWAGRLGVLNDPVGDAAQGYLDITGGRAFVNRDALYLLLEFADPGAPFVLFDMMFNADDRTYQITYQPGQTGLLLTDYTTGRGEFVKYLENSKAAFETAFEFRLDLDDLGRPGKLAVAGIGAMANTPSSWGPVDRWEGAIPPVVDEADPLRVGSEASPYFHARYWNLPEPYVGDAIVTSPLIYNAFVARSQDGTVYTSIGYGGEPGVSLINVQQGTATPILKLPSGIGISNPVGGPESTLLLGVGGEIWQIHPDGKHEVWGPSPNVFPFYYTNDGRLIGASSNGALVEIRRDGSSIELAGGFQWPIGDILVTPDGTILVYDIPTGDIIRVDPGGRKQVLVHAVLPGDGVNFGMDFDGQVYFNIGGYWDLRRLDINTGNVTPIPASYSSCTWNRGDIAFIEPGKLLLTGDQLSWSDLKSGENGILVHGITDTFAADIGPDGTLYIGASGCGDQIPAQVLRIASDGTQAVFMDKLRGLINQIVFAPDGGLYVASRDNDTNHVFYIAAGSQIPIEIPGIPSDPIMSMAVDPIGGNIFFSFARTLNVNEYDKNGFVRQHDFTFHESIYEFRLAFAPDGTLYGLAGFGINNTDFRGPWVLKLDRASGTASVIAELSHRATGVMSVFTVDQTGMLWVVVNPDSDMYQVTPEGNINLFASHLPVDVPAIRLDPAGNIYFTVAEGIYRIYREP
jgi:hypothetical protein